jgi:hypothetical protein
MEALLEHAQAGCEAKRDVFLNATEGAQLFERAAQRYLSISGKEFLRRWDAGYYTDPSERARAMRVALLIPFVRSVSARKNTR